MKKTFASQSDSFLAAPWCLPVLCAVSLMAAALSPLRAANGTWITTATGTHTWSQSSNWSGGVIADGAGAVGDFTTVNINTLTVLIDTPSRTLGILNFGDISGPQNYTIAGGSLIFDNNNTPAQINQTATSGANAISASVLLNDALSISNASANTLTISGAISGAEAISFSSSGIGGLTLSGSNTGYSGALNVTSGTVTLGSQFALNETNVVNVSSGATFNRGNANTSGSQGRLDIAGINGAGTVTRNGAGTRPLMIAGNGNYSFSGTINDGAGNPMRLIKAGTGTQVLSGVSTYTDGTVVVNGALQLDASTGSLATTGSLSLQGGRFVYDNTTSSGAKSQSLGALAFQNGSSIVESIKGGASSATLTFASLTARTTGATGNFVLTGGTAGTDNSIVLTGAAAGFLSQGLFVNGADYAYANATGSWVRAAQYGVDAGFVNAGASLTASSHNQVTSSITGQNTVTANTVKFAGAGSVDLSLNSGQVVTLANGGILRSGGGSTVINSGTIRAGNGIELVVRTNSASDSVTINSVIGTFGTNRLIKDGAGTLTLTAANAYTGQTHVNGGVLSISSNANLGSQTTGAALNLNNGTLQATASFGLFNGSAGVNDRAVLLANQGTFEVTGANVLTISGVIDDEYTSVSNADIRRGSVGKTGSGTLVLGGTNTYFGTTTVSAGTLLVNGSHTNAGEYTVGNGGTLGGSGSITSAFAGSVPGALAADVTLQSGGRLAAGNGGAGTLTVALGSAGLFDVSGAVGGANAGALAFELGTLSDMVLLTSGTLNIGAGILEFADFDFTALSGFGPGTYTLFDTSSTIEGSLGSSLTGTVGGFSATVAISGNDLVLDVVPEPAGVLLCSLGLAMVLWRSRRL